MKQEQLKRAKEIEKEIYFLEEYIEVAENPKRVDLHIKQQGNNGDTRYYGVWDDKTPEFLKSILTDQLDFIRLQLIQKVKKKIEELYDEFNNL